MILSLLVLFSITISICLSISLSWIEPATPIFPNGAQRGMCSGYHNRSIWLIGGYPDSRSKMEFNIDDNNYTKYDNVPDYIRGFAQQWTQIDHLLYIYPLSNQYIVTFNMQSNTYNDQVIFKNNIDLQRPCITNSDTEFLFVLGGYITNDTGYDIYQGVLYIFNIKKGVWMENGASMIQSRGYHSCNTHIDTLYVIGGQQGSDKLNTVEILHIDNMTNIYNHKWIILNDTLSSKRSHIRSVVYIDLIYVLGGHGDELDSKYSKAVDVIDTNTNSIRSNTNLMTATSVTAPVIVSFMNTLFVFGGYNENGALDTYQYAELVSIPTTDIPSDLSTEYDCIPSDDKSIYDAMINIKYIIQNLTEQNIQNTEIADIMDIIQQNYIITDIIQCDDFMLDLNGFYQEFNTILLDCSIRSRSGNAETLISISQSDDFDEKVTLDLIAKFTNNSNLTLDLIFMVKDKEGLSYYMVNEHNDGTDTMLILSLSIILIGFVFSILIKILNKCAKWTHIDNAKWLVPLLYSLQVYDFLTDINVSYIMLSDPSIYLNDSVVNNVLFWCGIGSVLCTVIPFTLNLLYGIRIKTQNVIKNNERSDTYFVKNIGFFIGLIIFCGGCYPSLLVVSSRIFNLNVLNSGLSHYELYNLAKIKIRTTIIWENCPQLFLQILYSSLTNTISSDLYLSFIASLLSIIMGIAVFLANKNSEKNTKFVTYDLKFYNKNDIYILSKKQKKNILRKKGRKEELEKNISKIFVISAEDIEIGFVTITNNGFKMHIAHCLSIEKLTKRIMMNDGRNIFEINEQKYIQTLFERHKDKINDVFRSHFEINDKDFIVKFIGDKIDDNTPLTMHITKY